MEMLKLSIFDMSLKITNLRLQLHLPEAEETILQNLYMFLVLSCSCLCPIHSSQVLIKNEDVVGAAPTGDAPATSEWSTISSPTEVPLILEVWQ